MLGTETAGNSPVCFFRQTIIEMQGLPTVRREIRTVNAAPSLSGPGKSLAGNT